MPYMPPYQAMREGIAVSPDGRAVLLSRDMFRMLIGALAQSTGFDPAWYRTQYPDVAEAIENGLLADELEHFAHCGYEEGRMPAHLAVDEVWYRDVYPDVDDGLIDGSLGSAEDHYNGSGYAEGRAASAGDEKTQLLWQDAIAQSAQIIQELSGGVPGSRALPSWQLGLSEPAV
jgi:hypothetical protein